MSYQLFASDKGPNISYGDKSPCTNNRSNEYYYKNRKLEEIYILVFSKRQYIIFKLWRFAKQLVII